MPSMKIKEHVLHILRILAGVWMLLLAYYFGAHLLDWKGSKGDAFVLMVMVLIGVCGTYSSLFTYLDALVDCHLRKVAYRKSIKDTFALFNVHYWDYHNLDGLPRDQKAARDLGIDKELPTAHDCCIYLYGWDPYEEERGKAPSDLCINFDISAYSPEERQELQDALYGVAKRFAGQYDTPENRAQMTKELNEAGRTWQLNHPPKVTALKIECEHSEDTRDGNQGKSALLL